jgi:hypothetical protein
MPKPKNKAGPPRGQNKNTKRRVATKITLGYDYIPESIIDREPDTEKPEDEDSASSRTKIDVPIAMWVCETSPCNLSRNLLRRIRILVIAIQNAAQGRNSRVWD